MKQRITTLQVTAILVNSIAPSAVLQLPAHVIHIVRQDGWITMMIALCAGLIFTYVIGNICNMSEGKPFMSWLESRLGRGIALVTGVCLCLYYFIVSVGVVRNFSIFVQDQLLKSTPMLVIAMVIVLVSIYIVWQGAEAMARIHYVVFLFAILLLFIIVSLLWGQFKWTHFQPMLEATPFHHMSALPFPIAWLSEITAVLFLLPYFEKPSNGARAALWATVISGLIMTLSVFQIIAVFGVKIIDALAYPSFTAISTVEVGNFAERIDVFLLSAWMMSMFAKVSIFLFCFFQTLDYTLRIKSKSNVIMAFVFAMFICAASVYSWPRNSNYTNFTLTTLTVYMLLNNYFIHLIVWIGLRLTRRKASAAEGGAEL